MARCIWTGQFGGGALADWLEGYRVYLAGSRVVVQLLPCGKANIVFWSDLGVSNASPIAATVWMPESLLSRTTLIVDLILSET
jgi:hypothetical protein